MVSAQENNPEAILQLKPEDHAMASGDEEEKYAPEIPLSQWQAHKEQAFHAEKAQTRKKAALELNGGGEVILEEQECSETDD